MGAIRAFNFKTKESLRMVEPKVINVFWPELMFSPVSLKTVSSAFWFYASEEEKQRIKDQCCSFYPEEEQNES